MSSQSEQTYGTDLDEIDRIIIDELVANARISNATLAQRAGIAPSTALLRTRSLVERGILTGYHAEVSLRSVGRTVQALISVKLRVHDREKIDTFVDRIPQLPEVLSMFHVSGGTDYLLHIAVSSTEALRDWVLDNLATDESVGHTETTLVFAHHQGHRGPLPSGESSL
ncbi:Lrp/AsnC family transcriptional regulator [Glutamicibacter protophormiae]|uniref:Lrp/AsnC family transcriptional regulator n=1 Tax=Glutamicibacter protophormiae TaxID=37930 RepID=UPI002A807072|nr:Lrp/AsnC family transcriptional regulator [Glutamicibacter protophormiae]WPR63584.1 Lrp/AsnC family transcriptional regulator [Glutamicibacter protophormiae]WPR67079.1 Lrp/AsnC family transcriptional regulator [Glutamicibacter protophormiae]